MRHRIRYYLQTSLLTAFCCLSHAVRAQIDEGDSLNYQVRASATGSYSEGNVAALVLRTKLEATIRHKELVLKTQNTSVYQEFFGKKADNDVSSRNYLYYKPDRTVYPFGIAFISSNYIRSIDLRYFAGAGATVRLLRNTKHQLRASAGLVHEQTQFAISTYNDARYNGNKSVVTWRITTWLAGRHLFSKQTSVYYELYAQPSIEDLKNYRWQASAGCDVAIWQGLSVTVLYTYTHEHLVVTRTQQNDKGLTFGITYRIKSNKS